MGTNNFTPNTRRFAVLRGSRVSDFDYAAYNDGLDEEDWLLPSDGLSAVADVVNRFIDTDLEAIHFEAAQMAKHTRAVRPLRDWAGEGLGLVEFTDSVQLNRSDFSALTGIPVEELEQNIPYGSGWVCAVELVVTARSGYYDGVQLVSELRLRPEYSAEETLDCEEELTSARVVDKLVEDALEWFELEQPSPETMRALAAEIRQQLARIEPYLWEEYDRLLTPFID